MIYLQNISIENFRSFGEKFVISLPDQGVTILTGPNGLGKTSLFDAIEWGLTGTVARLAHSEDDIRRQDVRRYYARRLADGLLSKQVSVKLQFSEFEPIERSSRLLSSSKEIFEDYPPPSESVLRILRSPDWTLPLAPEQIAVYLRQTHWLPQTTAQRFTAQDSEARWNSIFGLAGVERLAVLQDRLGLRLKRNLTEKRRDYQSKAEEKRALLESWTQLLDKRVKLRERAGSGGALSPADATAQLVSLETELRDVIQNLDPFLIGTDPIDRQLQLMLTALHARESVQAEVSARLEGVAQAPDQWLRQTAEIEVLSRAMAKAQQDVDAAKRRESVERIEVSALGEQLSTIRAQREEHEGHSRQLAYLASRIAEQARLMTEADGLASEIEALLRAEQSAASNAQEQRHRLGTLRQAEVDRRTLMADREALLGMQALLGDWQKRRQIEAPLSDELEALKSAMAAGLAQQEALKLTIAQQEDLHRDAAARLQFVRERVSVISQAVSIIAIHLTDASEDCPICASHFEAGELKRRVEAALHADQPKLAEAERSAENVRSLLEQLHEEARKLAANIEAQQARVAKIEQTTTASALLWEQLVSAPALAGVPPEPAAIEGHLSARLRHTEQALESLSQRLRMDGDAADLEAQTQQAEFRERESTTALILARERLHMIEQQLREISAALAAHPTIVSSLSDIAERNRTEQHSAQEIERLRMQENNLAALHGQREAQVNAAMQARTELEIQQARSQQALNGSRAVAEALQRQWESAGFGGQPSATALEAEREKLQLERPAVERARARHAQIVEGLQRWDAAVLLHEADELVRSTLEGSGSRTEALYAETLRTEREKAEADLAQVDVVRQAVDWLEGSVRQVADEYIRSVLGPVNEIAAQFLRALSVFFEQHVDIVRWAHGMNNHLTLRLRYDRSDSPDDLSANHLLSEGQLAAVSMSLLLGMSVAYRWSRWRGLLLDDPLQNNDIIHVSAFADVIRNLVQQQGYQIILSTHDSETSDFLYRKMRAADVPCTVCRFVAPSSTGVITECF
jgi:exonuclease SbcC